MRFQNFFEYNGKKYYTGTVVKAKFAHKGHNRQYVFLAYDKTCNNYICQQGDFKLRMYPDYFYNQWLAEVTNDMDATAQAPKEKLKNDANIDGLLFGWILYIFLMVISTIFVDRVMMWIIWSVIFFAYRSSAREKEGTRIEW